jgi:hypothetical protein
MNQAIESNWLELSLCPGIHQQAHIEIAAKDDRKYQDV